MVQKQKRAKIAERKRLIHVGPATKKLKNKSQSLSVSGKCKRKLLKKMVQGLEQKEVIEKGLVTIEDVEIVAAEGYIYMKMSDGLFLFAFAPFIRVLDPITSCCWSGSKCMPTVG
ncbi:hypothetical protein J1N35_007476 [Gossypium stocksii]|uniref:Uncharacterized protein n=1 Tax=Gossypium stocksii TaxID=47602 RepID=A0A9D3W7I7_9ROSI|nr:hypothetical protein J1N35_007476 [Gossypium stocksii]